MFARSHGFWLTLHKAGPENCCERAIMRRNDLPDAPSLLASHLGCLASYTEAQSFVVHA